MKFKKIVLGILGLSVAASLAACSSGSSSKNGLQKIQDKGELTVAISPDYPPFEYKTIVDGKDQTVGIDIDIAKAIAKHIGVKLRISNMSFDNVLGAVSTGKADVAISGISITKEREKTFDFSDAYYSDENVIIVKESDLSKYNDLNDFKGESLAGQTGSVQETAIKEQIKGANLVSLEDAGEEINEVINGKIAGTVMNYMVAKNYADTNPALAIANVKIPASSDISGKAVVIKKGSKELQKKVNETISELKKSGEMDKIIEEEYAASQKVN
ncbi:ABC transporter substrate-binding protein [Lactovum odontotermitis]